MLCWRQQPIVCACSLMFLPWGFFGHWSYLQLAKTYGNICTLWLGHRPMVVLYGFQAVKNGLTNNSEDVSGRMQTYTFNQMAGGKGKMFMSLEELDFLCFLLCFSYWKTLSSQLTFPVCSRWIILSWSMILSGLQIPLSYMYFRILSEQHGQHS